MLRLLLLLMLACFTGQLAFGQCTPNAVACQFPPDSLGIPFCLDPPPVQGIVGKPYDHTFQLAVRKNLDFPGVPLPLPITRIEILNVTQVPEGLNFELVNGNTADPRYNGTFPYNMKPPSRDPAPNVGIYGCGRITGTPVRTNAEQPFIQLEVRIYVRFITGETPLINLIRQFAPELADSFPDPLPLPLPLVITEEGAEQPVVNAGPDHEICAGESVQLGVSIEPEGDYRVIWTPPATLDDPTSLAPLASPTQTTSYVVTVLGAPPVSDTVEVRVRPRPAVRAEEVLPVGCQGDGRISLSITGGQAPYSVYLNGSLEAVEVPAFFSTSVSRAGLYEVRVEDATGCSAMIEVDVPGSQPMRVALVAQKLRVQPGQPDRVIIVSAWGGARPLEYSIDGQNFQSSGVFRNLRAGQYTVTARDSQGCTAQRAITLR